MRYIDGPVYMNSLAGAIFDLVEGDCLTNFSFGKHENRVNVSACQLHDTKHTSRSDTHVHGSYHPQYTE